jgi:hypothetical protein
MQLCKPKFVASYPSILYTTRLKSLVTNIPHNHTRHIVIVATRLYLLPKSYCKIPVLLSSKSCCKCQDENIMCSHGFYLIGTSSHGF